MLLRYLKASKSGSDELKKKAFAYVREGYQRVLNYQNSDGGFGLFCGQCSELVYTAYAGQFFADMQDIYPIDGTILPKIRAWLSSRRNQHGGWLGDNRAWLASTAFTLTGLEAAGGSEDELDSGRQWLVRQTESEQDPYALALCLNALPVGGRYQSVVTKIAERLATLARKAPQLPQALFWENRSRTLFRSYGMSGDCETTGLALQGFLRHGLYFARCREAIAYLMASRSPQGDWYTTPATVAAIKAIITASWPATSDNKGLPSGVFHFYLDSELRGQLNITPDTQGVRHLIELGRPTRGDTRLRIAYVAQSGQMPSYAMQLVTNYYLPWQPQESASKKLELTLVYPQQPPRAGETIEGKATITHRGTEATGMLILSWGLPPGTEPVRERLDAQVGTSFISRYELAGNRLVFYLTPMEPASVRIITCPLRAVTVNRSQTPVSQVYDYYTPTLCDTTSPADWSVEQRE
jgi:CD109 antigen